MYTFCIHFVGITTRVMLKRLFTSNTRIKLLTVFLMNQEKEYFIRELTRKLDEQINSVRRELDNLKKVGLLKARAKNRKKFYYVNKDFILLDELKGIIIKVLSSNESLAKDIGKLGKIKLLALSGQLVGRQTESVDMLIVGEVNKEKFAKYLNTELRTKKPIKFTIMDEEDYKYRIACKDKFITDLIKDPQNQVPIKKI